MVLEITSSAIMCVLPTTMKVLGRDTHFHHSSNTTKSVTLIVLTVCTVLKMRERGKYEIYADIYTTYHGNKVGITVIFSPFGRNIIFSVIFLWKTKNMFSFGKYFVFMLSM